MKKLLLVLSIFVIGYMWIQKEVSDIVLIPNEAIRLRVIANSNSIPDQEVKTKVKDELEQVTYNLLKKTSNVTEARTTISENLKIIDQSVKQVLEEEHYKKDYKINFGQNYFPEKEYKGVVYEEGEYESLVVTLGEGQGNNWWCVLFPPLCLLEAEEIEKDEVEYKFFVQELIDKFF